MSDNTSEKSVKKPFWKKVLWVAFVVILLVYAVFLTVVNRNLTNERDQQQIQALALSQLPGQACGVLSPELAKATIGEPVKQAARNNQSIPFEDGCTYTNPNNSSYYASLVIKSYPSQKDAAEAYSKERALRVESENRDPGEYADEVYYSAGTFFVLKGDQTIAVGAFKEGIDNSTQEAFSKKLLDSVINNI